MTIVVLEQLTSMPRAACGACLASEGRAMRDAVVVDLLRLPEARVVLLGRSRFRLRDRERLRQVDVKLDAIRALRSEVRRADGALVIASEVGGHLERLSRIVEEEDRVLFGPSARAVRLAADKLRMHRLLAEAGLPTPRSEAVTFRSARGDLARRRLPFVLKPRDGFGCQGVSLVRRTAQIPKALSAARSATTQADLLVQDHVPGEDASVSVLVADGPRSGARPRILPLGLNRQRLTRRGGLRYLGGETPWRHPLSLRAIGLALRGVEALARAAPGVRGYIGLDLILGPEGPWIIEVNPRITTSYLGLREVVEPSVVGLLRDAVLGRDLPASVRTRGRCRFGVDGSVVRARGRSVGPGRAGSQGKARWLST